MVNTGIGAVVADYPPCVADKVIVLWLYVRDNDLIKQMATLGRSFCIQLHYSDLLLHCTDALRYSRHTHLCNPARYWRSQSLIMETLDSNHMPFPSHYQGSPSLYDSAVVHLSVVCVMIVW